MQGLLGGERVGDTLAFNVVRQFKGERWDLYYLDGSNDGRGVCLGHFVHRINAETYAKLVAMDAGKVCHFKYPRGQHGRAEGVSRVYQY